jgi:hypothetical protein
MVHKLIAVHSIWLMRQQGVVTNVQLAACHATGFTWTKKFLPTETEEKTSFRPSAAKGRIVSTQSTIVSELAHAPLSGISRVSVLALIPYLLDL